MLGLIHALSYQHSKRESEGASEMTNMISIQGETYVEVDGETYRGTDGSVWFREAHVPLLQTVQAAQANMILAQQAGLRIHANATAYLEALETRTAAEADLEILEQLWDL